MFDEKSNTVAIKLISNLKMYKNLHTTTAFNTSLVIDGSTLSS